MFHMCEGYYGNYSYLDVWGQSVQVRGTRALNVALASVDQESTQSTAKVQKRYQWTILKSFDIIATIKLKLSFKRVFFSRKHIVDVQYISASP